MRKVYLAGGVLVVLVLAGVIGFLAIGEKAMVYEIPPGRRLTFYGDHESFSGAQELIRSGPEEALMLNAAQDYDRFTVLQEKSRLRILSWDRASGLGWRVMVEEAHGYRDKRQKEWEGRIGYVADQDFKDSKAFLIEGTITPRP